MKALVFIFLLMTTSLFSQDWFKSQVGTGPGNCGPACVAMSIEYSTGEIVSVEDIRNEIGYTRKNGATDFEELTAVLDSHNIEYNLLDSYKLAFNLNRIYILLVDTIYITTKPYNYNGRHYIILNGIDGFYYKVQDPLTKNEVKYKIMDIRRALKGYPIIEVIGENRTHTQGRAFVF